MTFQLFFLLIHMQPEALVLRFISKTGEWLIGLWVCRELQRSRRRAMAEFYDPRQACRSLHAKERRGAKVCHPTTTEKRAWIETFFKIIHDLSQRKSTRRAQLNEVKEKEIFVFFAFARLQFYMQCTLNINYLSSRSPSFITSAFICALPASTFKWTRFFFLFILHLCLLSFNSPFGSVF